MIIRGDCFVISFLAMTGNNVFLKKHGEKEDISGKIRHFPGLSAPFPGKGLCPIII